MSVHALHPRNQVTSRFRAKRLLEFPLEIRRRCHARSVNHERTTTRTEFARR
jgi:hypothetical protein